MTAGFWNDERLRQLRALAKEGLTAVAIAERMNFGREGRNKVIGACHRYGIELARGNGHGRHRKQDGGDPPKNNRPRSHSHASLQSAIKPNSPFPPAQLGRPKRPHRANPDLSPIEKAPPKPLPLLKATGSGRVAIADLEDHHCRYPFGDHPPYLYCGNPKRERSSYCAKHSVLCEQLREQRRRA